MAPPCPPSAQNLKVAFNGSDNYPVLDQLWPERRSLSLNDALQTLGLHAERDELFKSVEHLISLETLVPAPIVAVLGSLNGGKSSCVASLLSEVGERRIPRGTADICGTHRFVFWVPRKWDDRTHGAQIWSSVERQLQGAFGSAVEFLSEEVETAHHQYNGAGDVGGLFSLPLVAFDERLDELNLCLIDCPDVESKVENYTASDRLETLRRAAGILSGVIFIAAEHHVRAQVLSDIVAVLQAKAKAPARFLLINSVRVSQGDLASRVANRDVQALKQSFAADRVFAAYDFDASSNCAADVLPNQAARAAGLQEGFPWFFEVSGEKERNEADGVTEDRMLVAHLRKIDASDLWEHSRLDAREALRGELENTRMALRRTCEDHLNDLRQWRERLIGFIHEQLTDGDELKIPFTESLLRRLSTDIYQAAPWWARPALKMNAIANGFKTKIFTVGKKVDTVLNPGSEIRQKVQNAKTIIQGKKGDAFFNPYEFARIGQRCGIARDGLGEKELESAWEEIFQVIRTDAVADVIPKDEFDQFAREIWDKVPFPKKLIFAATGPVLFLVGLLVVSVALVDMGTTAVIFTASTTKLLAIAGVSGLASFGGAAALAKLDTLLRRYVAVPTYGRIVSAACDVFGLPRWIDSPLEKEFREIGKVKIDLESLPVLPSRVRLTESIQVRESSTGWKGFEKVLPQN